ncbi:hypothetical protein AB0O91_12140 [Kitasatospora sp. NPDC089797]|uniref:hypothetical protein n=1 Tax=Kitasatospora sp. NPDC089797 TaxID=3155298 RepID=UPI00341ED8C9
MGEYTVASMQADPFAFAELGCSERAMAVRVEGVDDSAQLRKTTGDSLRYWKSGRYVVVAVGAADAIKDAEAGGQDPPEP